MKSFNMTTKWGGKISPQVYLRGINERRQKTRF